MTLGALPAAALEMEPFLCFTGSSGFLASGFGTGFMAGGLSAGLVAGGLSAGFVGSFLSEEATTSVRPPALTRWLRLFSIGSSSLLSSAGLAIAGLTLVGGLALGGEGFLVIEGWGCGLSATVGFVARSLAGAVDVVFINPLFLASA